MSTVEKERSSIGVYVDTKERFDDAKPYDSMSADEFVDVLLDRWEGRR
jgi:hypothetical protein